MAGRRALSVVQEGVSNDEVVHASILAARMDLLDLKGKTAAVTGAGTGIGRATADLMEKAGAKVSRIDIEPAPGILTGDVADEAAMEKILGSIGPLDILVNNAGVAVRKNAYNISREEWDRLMAVNLTGLFLCSRI